MGIVRFALKFPHTFFVLAALILVLGVSAIVSMPTDIFPEINIPVVTVIWQEAAGHHLQPIFDLDERQRHQGYRGADPQRHLHSKAIFPA
jgi:hypothetical protein